ncbi:MAG: hypothetical protein JNM31_04265 [Flavobacteriales bacterium]|nr:hypothetical protein [Flavobacteriales bacterium]
MRSVVFILFMPLWMGNLTAQRDSTWVRAGSAELVLHPGIYADFAAFRTNRPTYPLTGVVNDQDIPVRDLRSGGRMFVRDTTGSRKEVQLDRQWGLSQNNGVYIRAGIGFYRIGMMGSLCHVLFEQNQRDWDPYGYPFGGSTVRTVQQQYVLDMETGAFQPFTAATMEVILARDEVLKAEWDTLPPKKRGQEVLVLFLRRYNERHPLYFPR